MPDSPDDKGGEGVGRAADAGDESGGGDAGDGGGGEGGGGGGGEGGGGGMGGATVLGCCTNAKLSELTPRAPASCSGREVAAWVASAAALLAALPCPVTVTDASTDDTETTAWTSVALMTFDAVLRSAASIVSSTVGAARLTVDEALRLRVTVKAVDACSSRERSRRLESRVTVQSGSDPHSWLLRAAIISASEIPTGTGTSTRALVVMTTSTEAAPAADAVAMAAVWMSAARSAAVRVPATPTSTLRVDSTEKINGAYGGGGALGGGDGGGGDGDGGDKGGGGVGGGGKGGGGTGGR